MMMLKEENLTQFEQALQRIFAMKVSRSTFREVQNVAIACTEGNQEEAQVLFEALVKGQAAQGSLSDEGYTKLQSMIDKYSVPIRLAREVTEKGEFIKIITSDALRQGDMYAFLNRIRRIDGEEFQFIADLEGMLYMLLHISGRLQELQKADSGKQALGKYQEALQTVQSQVADLLKKE